MLGGFEQDPFLSPQMIWAPFQMVIFATLQTWLSCLYVALTLTLLYYVKCMNSFGYELLYNLYTEAKWMQWKALSWFVGVQNAFSFCRHGYLYHTQPATSRWKNKQKEILLSCLFEDTKSSLESLLCYWNVISHLDFQNVCPLMHCYFVS